VTESSLRAAEGMTSTAVGRLGIETGSPWTRELGDFVRAASGAFLFGAPLLFTMEMWWLGTYAAPWKLLVLLGVAFIANLGLAHFAGFKREGHSFAASAEQAVEAVAVGIVASLVVLLALNRIGPSDPLDVILGKIVVQVVPLSVGASVANAVFARGMDRQGDAAQPRHSSWQATLNDIGATATGGVLIGFSIAPTDEVSMLAVELTSGHLLAVIALSLVLTYAIVFESGFDRTHVTRPGGGMFQSPIAETVAAYVVSLLVAAGALFLFNELDLDTPFRHVLAQVLVLGMPAAIGGAAGRLVV
jgi:putative integral membrane protein (TIGR02587 family)